MMYSANRRDSPASCRSSAQTRHCLLSDLSPNSIKPSPSLCLHRGFPLPCSAPEMPRGLRPVPWGQPTRSGQEDISLQ